MLTATEPGMPLQGHAAREARPVLPGELHAQGQKQQQVRQEEGFARDPQAIEKLRTHEASHGSLDRSGHGAIKSPPHERNELTWDEGELVTVQA